MYFTLRASRLTRSAVYIASTFVSARHFDLLQLYIKMATGSNSMHINYRICPYRGRAQIEAGVQIVAGSQEVSTLIEAGVTVYFTPHIKYPPE